MRLTFLNKLEMKKSYWYLLGGSSLVIIAGLICLKLYKASTIKPQPMTHTLEYNAVVDEHIDTSKIARADIDLAVTMQVIGQRLAVYQFSHPKLRGKWGDLNVVVDRQTGKSISRSLLSLNKAKPTFAASNLANCLMVEQPGQNTNEVCVR